MDDIKTPTPDWRRGLLNRLARALGRDVVEADMPCIEFNDTVGTLTVYSALRAELKARNLISSVFRCRDFKH